MTILDDAYGTKLEHPTAMKPVQTEIQGLLIPSNWNRDGEIQGIKIMTFDEDQFEIAPNDMGRALEAYLRCFVTLAGQVAAATGTQKFIIVERFTIHDPEKSF